MNPNGPWATRRQLRTWTCSMQVNSSIRSSWTTKSCHKILRVLNRDALPVERSHLTEWSHEAPTIPAQATLGPKTRPWQSRTNFQWTLKWYVRISLENWLWTLCVLQQTLKMPMNRFCWELRFLNANSVSSESSIALKLETSTMMIVNSDEIGGIVGTDVVLFYSCFAQSRLYCCRDFSKYTYVRAQPFDKALPELHLTRYQSNGGFATGCYSIFGV